MAAGRIPDTSAFGADPVPQPTLSVASWQPQQSNIGREISGAGRDIQDAADTIAETNLRQDSIVAQSKANALTGAVAELQNGENGYSTVRGSNAVGAKFLGDYTTRFGSQLDAIRSTIDSPAQQRIFDAHAQVIATQYRAGLLQHQAVETDKFNAQTEDDTINLARRSIFSSNGEKVGTAAGIAQLDWAIDQKAARLGWSPETTDQAKQTYLSKVYDDAADLMRAQDPAGMLALINQRLGQAAAPAATATPTDPSAPRGIRNNNPGNLEAAGWQGQTGTDGRFATFATPQDGIRAAARNLLAYQDGHGLNTIGAIVARWAPAADGNDVAAYTASVAKETGLPADKPLDLHDSGTMMKLVTAMVSHENGQQPYPPGVIQEGVAAGLGLPMLNPQSTPAALAGPPAPGGGVPDLADLHATATGNSVIDGGSLTQLMEWRRQAHIEVERTQMAGRSALEQKTKDFQSMVMAGVSPPSGSVPSPQEYAAAFGPAADQRYKNDVSTYLSLGLGLGAMKDASFSERQALLAQFTPQAGPGFESQQRVQSTLAQANQLMEKQIAVDPASFAGRSARVQASAAAMQQALGDKDATSAQRSAAVDAYVATTTAEQQRLGIENIRQDALGEEGKARQLGVRLLTNGQANAIAQQFQSSSANAAQLMDGLHQQWGSHFPQVFDQLVQDEKIPPGAMVIANMSDPFAKETLARLADPKLQKQILEGLPAGSMKDVAAKLQQLNEPFYGSFAYQEGGQRTFATVSTQQRVLAAAYVMQGHSASDASRIAFEQTVGHAYQFNDTLRIPKAEQPDQVMTGARAVAANPALLATQAPQSFRPNLSPADRDAAWHDSMRTGATWVANSDETGATLYVRGRNDAGADALFAVRDPGGKPLTWTWSQLRTIAAQQPPPRPGAPLGAGVPVTRGDAGDQAVARARAAAAGG